MLLHTVAVAARRQHTPVHELCSVCSDGVVATLHPVQAQVPHRAPTRPRGPQHLRTALQSTQRARGRPMHHALPDRSLAISDAGVLQTMLDVCVCPCQGWWSSCPPGWQQLEL